MKNDRDSNQYLLHRRQVLCTSVNLRTALYAWLLARAGNGKFIVRIEDTDQVRLVEGAVEVILQTLSQTGLNYDEGPGVGGPNGPYVQKRAQGDLPQICGGIGG